MSEQKPSEQYREFIPYNPENDSGLGSKTVRLGDSEVIIHETSNLPILFGAFMKLRSSSEPSNPLENLYYEIVKNNDSNIQNLITEFIDSQPELFAELEAIYQSHEEEALLRKQARERFDQGSIPTIEVSKKGLPDETEVARRQYYYSQMFDTLADLAKSNNPAYDLTVICR